MDILNTGCIFQNHLLLTFCDKDFMSRTTKKFAVNYSPLPPFFFQAKIQTQL